MEKYTTEFAISNNSTTTVTWNNTSSYTDDKYASIERFFNTILIPCVAGFGSAGNLINVIVLGRLKLKRADDSGTTFGFLLLALSDMLICISLLPRIKISSAAIFEGRNFSLYFHMYGTSITNGAILLSVWLATSTTALRYLAICQPMLSWPRSSWHAYITYAISSLVAIVLALPGFWQYYARETDDGRVYLDVGPNWGRSEAYMYSQLVIGISIPFLCLVYCNVSLIGALRHSLRIRRMANVPTTTTLIASSRITLVLIVFIVMFIILVLPCEALNVVVSSTSKYDTPIVMLTRVIANFLQIAHFSCSFLLHCLLNVHFRRELVSLILCRKTPAFNERTNNSRRYTSRNTAGGTGNVPLIVRKRFDNNYSMGTVAVNESIL